MTIIYLPIPEPSSQVDPESERILRDEEGWRRADVACPVLWRRWCGACRAFQMPSRGPAPRILVWAGDDEDLSRYEQVFVSRNYCPACRTPWPGPPLLAQWREDMGGRVFQLRLSASSIYCTYTLSVDLARQFRDAVDISWQEMEREILYGLTYRETCAVTDCEKTGRVYMRTRSVLGDVLPIDVSRDGVKATRYVRLPPGPFWLCHPHEYEALRALNEETGLPLVDWRTRIAERQSQ